MVRKDWRLLKSGSQKRWQKNMTYIIVSMLRTLDGWDGQRMEMLQEQKDMVTV